jgi:uncharacterized protein YbdZ (MbtH family)
MMAIASSRAPDRVVVSANPLVNGKKYKEVLQANVDYFVLAQKGDGGWWYPYPWYAGSDNSNTGWAVLGLRYAEAPLYGFNIAIPAATKVGLNNWIDYIQNDVGVPDDPWCDNAGTGDCDGGSGYTDPGSWVNLLKTGNLLFEMSFFGDGSGTQRAQDAVDYIERHWNDANNDPGWRPNHYQSMFCMMKGFQSMGIDTITVGGPVDWFNEFADAIIASQNPDGSWPADYWDWGDTYCDATGCKTIYLLSTTWALLTLEKVSPPPPVDVDVEVPDCACDKDGYKVTVTYTVERIPSDGKVTVFRDSSFFDVVVLDDFSGTATKTYDIAFDTPSPAHVWEAVIEVTPSGGGGVGKAEDKDVIRVCETPDVLDIPDQNAPFVPFDLDNYVVYGGGGGGGAIVWSVSGVPAGWTVAIDPDNVVIVTPPEGSSEPATLTFTATISCCGKITCSDSDDAKFTPNTPPAGACVQSVNPSGKNIPKAQNQNQDGFYQLLGKDKEDGMAGKTVMVFVTNRSGTAVFGPFPSGTVVKITEAPGATPSIKPMGGPGSAVPWHITLNSDALAYAMDSMGWVSPRVACLVPPPPK